MKINGEFSIILHFILTYQNTTLDSPEKVTLGGQLDKFSTGKTHFSF